METPLRQVHNNPLTITTRSQQLYDQYPTKDLQYSQYCDNLTATWQQVHKTHNGSTITVLQQLYNKFTTRWYGIRLYSGLFIFRAEWENATQF